MKKNKNISVISQERLIILKNKIIKILQSYKIEHNDIPYIITYQRNLYEPELEPILKIFYYDNEWNSLIKMKNDIYNELRIYIY